MFFSVSRHRIVKVAIVVNLIYTYLTRRIESQEKAGPGGAIYLPYLVVPHTTWSAQKGMSTFKGLGT